MTRLLVVFSAVLLWAAPAAATCSGSGVTWSCTTSTTIAQINTAIGSSTDGATITFAAGSYSWGATLSFSTSKATTLICATVRGCTVTMSGTLWQWANFGTVNKTHRISGFVFNSVSPYFIWLYGTGATAAIHNSVRFDHNTVNVASSASDIIAFGEVTGTNGRVYGVFDNNIFTTANGNSRYFVFYAQSQVVWPSDTTASANNLFIEANTFTNECMDNAGNADMDNDGGLYTWVVRYNAFTNGRTEHHGYYGIGSAQGPASSEIYGNTFTWTCGEIGTQQGTYSMKHQGSGEWMVFDNMVTPTGGKGDPQITQNYRSFYFASGGCDGNAAQDGNRSPIGTWHGYPCERQPGRTDAGVLKPQYYWNNRWNDNTEITMSLSCSGGAASYNWCSIHVVADRDYYQGGIVAQTSASSPFAGTSGTGFGTLARRPTTCTPTPESADAGNGGVGYWATDVGVWNRTSSAASGRLYRCSATNTWTLAYTPSPYPHPLAASTAVPASPTNPRVQ